MTPLHTTSGVESRRPHRLLGLLVAVASAAIMLAASGSTASANFLEDFEGDGEASKLNASLRHWNTIESVDLVHVCHSSGACIDLVGTTGSVRGGIISKESFTTANYLVGFFLYGSGRSGTGEAVASGGTVSRVQVSLGSQSIFARNNISSNFQQFVVLRVRGAGKLKFQGTGQVPNIGPLVDNIVILRAN